MTIPAILLRRAPLWFMVGAVMTSVALVGTAMPASAVPSRGDTEPDSTVSLGGTMAPYDPVAVAFQTERFRVTPTDQFPARAVAQLTRDDEGETVQYCTGLLISPDTIATAGHCVYSHSSGSYEGRGVRAWLGRDGAAAPFGSCAVIDMWATPEWINGALPRYDYGAMKLDCTIGNSVGWFDLWWQVEPLDGTTISINGYPCDTGFGEQWTSTDFVHETQERAIYSELNTFSCQSGSPVYTEDIAGCAGLCVVAIHVARNTAFSIHNRITEDVYDNLMAFASS